MIEVRNAYIEFGASVSPERAEAIVREALRLAGRLLPHQDGLLKSVILPDVAIAPGMGVRASSEALAGALVHGIANARGKNNA